MSLLLLVARAQDEVAQQAATHAVTSVSAAAYRDVLLPQMKFRKGLKPAGERPGAAAGSTAQRENPATDLSVVSMNRIIFDVLTIHRERTKVSECR